MKMRGSGNEVIAERQPGDGDLLKKAALTLSRRRVVGSTFAAGLAAITMQFLGFSPAYADCSSQCYGSCVPCVQESCCCINGQCGCCGGCSSCYGCTTEVFFYVCSDGTTGGSCCNPCC
jgi:hypothetical protein